MIHDIKANAYANLEETIEKIQKIVQINSIRDTADAAQGAPFGKGIANALDLYLKFANEIGMSTYRDPKGYYGYADIGPETEQMIGIIAHLDVVPVGDIDQWTKASPFSGELIDNCIYGRGTLDDKGPAIVALMSIKTLIDSGVEFKKKIRIILGTAEETTTEGIRRYKEIEKLPTIGFTPDADFPLINAEKTIYRCDFKKNQISDINFSLKAQGPYNAVNDKAIYTGLKHEEIASYLNNKEVEFTHIDNQIIVSGKSAHSMECFKGDNAIFYLVDAMYNVGEKTKLIDAMYTNMLYTYHGEKMFGNVQDEVSGKLTVNVGWIDINEKTEAVGFDLRIPVLVDYEKIIEKLNKAFKSYGLELENEICSEKLYISENEVLVKELLKAYQDVTKDYESKPLSTGGGTYAREFKNTVAFGMVFKKQGMIDIMHQPNECLQIEYIPLGIEIYAKALKGLLEN